MPEGMLGAVLGLGAGGGIWLMFRGLKQATDRTLSDPERRRGFSVFGLGLILLGLSAFAMLRI